MSSEFPMTFPEESKVASVHPKKRSEKKKKIAHSEKPIDVEKRAPTGKTSSKKNVIPISRHADSVLPPLSEVAQMHSGSSSGSGKSTLGDYPMSEYLSGDEGESHSPRSGKRRVILRSLLGFILLGLWAAIGTGNLHSELPLLADLRSQFASDDQRAQDSVSPMGDKNDVPSQPETGLQSAAVSQSTVGPAMSSTPTSVVGASDLPAAQSTLSASSVTQPALPASLPSSLSSGDVEKAVGLFLAQGAQNNALEEHLVQLLMQNSAPEKVDSLLDAMERRHREALDSLNALRKKKKASSSKP